jgi:hypothetical protein
MTGDKSDLTGLSTPLYLGTGSGMSVYNDALICFADSVFTCVYVDR